MMQTPKGSRTSSPVSPARTTPKRTRQLKNTAVDSDSVSSPSPSSQSCNTSKGRNPKASERRSARTPVPEAQKKYSSRVSELESDVSRLREGLKKAKDQLILSESLKTQAQQDAKEFKKELLALSLKFEESQKRLRELSASEETPETALQTISRKHDRTWRSELEPARSPHSVNSATLPSPNNEIQWVDNDLNNVDESEAEQTIVAQSANEAIFKLEKELAENFSVLEIMTIQLRKYEESETQAQALVTETLMQLETAKRTIETLKADGIKSMDAYNSTASELEQSRARVSMLEELVNKLKFENPADELKFGKSEPANVRFQMGGIRSALEASDIRHREEQIRSPAEIRSSHELLEEIKSTVHLREAALEAELQNARADIEELKAKLLDKETELQVIMEGKGGLAAKLEKSCLLQREWELQTMLRESEESVTSLKAELMDRETELQNILEENEALTLEIEKREIHRAKSNDEVEKVRAAEREALMKLALVMEDAEKSSRKVARVAEQLEASQAANLEMEAELRKLMVQSNQWRKAAETAAAMLSASAKGEFMDTAGSLDSSKYDGAATGRVMSSPCYEDGGDDSPRKRNGSVLKKITVLWKKQH